MVHLFVSSVTAAASLWWRKQVRKGIRARGFILDSIRSDRRELDLLRDKYAMLLEKKTSLLGQNRAGARRPGTDESR